MPYSGLVIYVAAESVGAARVSKGRNGKDDCQRYEKRFHQNISLVGGPRLNRLNESPGNNP